MTNNARKRSQGTHASRSPDTNSKEMNPDVLEWLESERIEHERRMQELGCHFKSARKQPEAHDKDDLNK